MAYIFSFYEELVKFDHATIQGSILWLNPTMQPICFSLFFSLFLWYDLTSYKDHVMQENNWGNRDRQKKNKNRTNPRNHHLESACKTLGITT